MSTRDCYHIEACPHFVAVILRAQRAEAELAALRPAPVTQCEAEPVGWYSTMRAPQRDDFTTNPDCRDDWQAQGQTLIPLYAAPPSRSDAVNAGLRQREALAITRLRAAVSGEEFEWEVNGGSPFDDAKFLVDAYDRALVALWKIAGLIDSEDGEPLDDAIRIARAALSTDPGTVAVASAERGGAA